MSGVYISLDTMIASIRDPILPEMIYYNWHCHDYCSVL